MIWISSFSKLYAQSLDSLTHKEKINVILGTKLFITKAFPEIRMASNIGADWYLFKNKKINIAYRNFFSVFITPPDPYFKKNIAMLSTSNCVSFCYKIPIKNNYLKFGLGPYHSREQVFLDQIGYIIDPHKYGLEFSAYTKLRWLNIVYRHQFQLANNRYVYLNFNELYMFSLCLEVPISLK